MKLKLYRDREILNKEVLLYNLDTNTDIKAGDIIRTPDNKIWILDSLVSYPSGRFEGIIIPYFIFRNKRRTIKNEYNKKESQSAI